MKKLLVANRGEIAIRIMRSAAEAGLATVAIYPEDDAGSSHVEEADEAVMLPGAGTSAYLAIDAVIEAALAVGADAIHPGYGFLSENAAFARACVASEIRFVGPRPETLELFGDKARARAHAQSCGVPMPEGTQGPTSLEEARSFLTSLGPGGAIMLKAIAGGGGRGMRPVEHILDLDAAFARCTTEAHNSFGDGALYAERLFPCARHVEVQIVGDGSGAVSHLWDRECTLQRARQKIVEWAPADAVPGSTRQALLDAAVRLARQAKLLSLATVEFLVTPDGDNWAFLEVNPRLQVEHTVTEEVMGLDLVRVQLALADGATLADLGLEQDRIAPPRGHAMQVRVNLETMTPDGARPTAGVIAHYSPPTGRGIRVDGFAHTGYRTSLRYDPLLAKLIVSVPEGGFPAVSAKALRALESFQIGGVDTNIRFLRALLAHPVVRAGGAHVRFVDEDIDALLDAEAALPTTKASGVEDNAAGAATIAAAPEGTVPLSAPMLGMLVSMTVATGDTVVAGQEVAVVEAMKMQHGVTASHGGIVAALAATVGDMLLDGQPILFMRASGDAHADVTQAVADIDPDHIRPDLAEVLDRHRGTLDAARPDAVARRRKTGHRTARENLDHLLDEGSFVEYGGLAIAGRSRRASTEELVEQSPADGLVMGLGTVNADLFGAEQARVATMAYDYTVFAGTQGARNHVKTDRLVELADRWRIPFIQFAEGGGGRPGDTDGGGFIRAFEWLPKLSGRVPMVGIVSGRCFAGNASFLGCSDVVIATRDTTLGMGGPAMIEGGGLGVFKPEEVGPAAVHVANGVIDLLVDDEAAAVAAARQYIGYFQGSLAEWSCADQRGLRHAIPENRLRVYDIRALISILVDEGSWLELRRGFGLAMVIGLARIEGRPVGIIANDPSHLGGAIDSDAADKGARFLQLCEAHGLPVVSLSDTPGIMVGPEVEKTGLVRHAARMFVIGANLTVPLLSVVLRKSYGLGAIAMTGGSYQASFFSVAWPTGEFGGMGLEGAVRLGYRKELEAIADPAARQAKFDEMVAQLYRHGKALTTAGYYGIDDVIDPADTRRWISAALRTVPPAKIPEEGKRLRWIDPW
ncbi:carboxyl transferase domain-containing protein [Sphingopyxis granuli]|uniref:carboxyl transferase domain-containing protein n=1 Tax=Sphingopyxis granuli TaxID=267128 RepID=UPI000830FD99|nr:carboxyl transferase domain-containing protein [Sphingopyxis granuli]